MANFRKLHGNICEMFPSKSADVQTWHCPFPATACVAWLRGTNSSWRKGNINGIFIDIANGLLMAFTWNSLCILRNFNGILMEYSWNLLGIWIPIRSSCSHWPPGTSWMDEMGIFHQLSVAGNWLDPFGAFGRGFPMEKARRLEKIRGIKGPTKHQLKSILNEG